MNTVYDLEPNFPSYQNVKIGDIMVWFMGDHKRRDFDTGEQIIHGHWFEVVGKATRYAEVDLKKIKCDNPKGVHCSNEDGEVQTIGWSKLQFHESKTRWLLTPGAKVLYSTRG